MIILECPADIEKSEGISWPVICCSNNGLPLFSHSTMSCASPGCVVTVEFSTVKMRIILVWKSRGTWISGVVTQKRGSGHGAGVPQAWLYLWI